MIANIFKTKPSFLARLFGLAKWDLEIDKNGLIVQGQKYRWVDIKSANRESSLLWSNLNLELNDTVLELVGVQRKLARELEFASITLPHLIFARDQFNKLLKREVYFRNRDIREIVDLVYKSTNIDSKKHLGVLIESKFKILKSILSPLLKTFEHIEKLTQKDYSKVSEWNEKFIAHEKDKFRDFFYTVESSPLTEEQIKASIIMEDNNLLIAAAGSGKTSVIVSKLGYLIKKGYAKPDEILVLSFNNKVKDEINFRIKDGLTDLLVNNTYPIVHTFHSFGYSVIKAGKLNKRTPAWIGNESKTLSHLNTIFYDVLKTNNEIATEVVLFITFDELDDDETSQLFEASKDSASELANLAYRDIGQSSIKELKTLDGKHVRSLQELKISNWLTIFGIEYKYEKGLSIKDYDNYRPDFYYPKIDCWHEHFGINKLGKAPAHFFKDGKTSYEDLVKEKRRLLNKSKVNWFETTSADFYDSTWHIKINEKLKDFGETPEFIGWDRYQYIVRKFNKENDTKDFSELPLISLLLTSIKHFKSNQLTFEDVERKISSIRKNDRYQRFFKIFKAIYERYEVDLAADNNIDFEDMLNESTRLIKESKVTHPFKFILIDEFQDMSNARAKLTQSLKSQNSETILFAVGDDWQSIYRFAGADSSNMITFQEKFGFTRTTMLTRTFRFNQGIADVSSEFIQRNPQQIMKKVTAIDPGRKNRVRYVGHEKIKNFPVKDSEDFDRTLHNQLNIIKTYALSKEATNKKKISVALLGRYHHLRPDNFDSIIKEFSDWLDISFSTIHSAKGLGWDFVLILGMDNTFPSTKSDDEVLSLFMTQPDSYENAEERRLFYVALTRAKKAAILLGNYEKPSEFIIELADTDFEDVFKQY